MVSWLIGIAVVLLLWSGLWRSHPKAAFGAIFGWLIAWLLSYFIYPYITGMEKFPIWLAPLPVAFIAIVLFVFGVITWMRADNLPAPKQVDDDHGGHGHGDGAHGHH